MSNLQEIRAKLEERGEEDLAQAMATEEVDADVIHVDLGKGKVKLGTGPWSADVAKKLKKHGIPYKMDIVRKSKFPHHYGGGMRMSIQQQEAARVHNRSGIIVDKKHLSKAKAVWMHHTAEEKTKNLAKQLKVAMNQSKHWASRIK